MKEKLLELLNNSYSPYSKFRVAAISAGYKKHDFEKMYVM